MSELFSSGLPGCGGTVKSALFAWAGEEQEVGGVAGAYLTLGYGEHVVFAFDFHPSRGHC